MTEKTPTPTGEELREEIYREKRRLLAKMGGGDPSVDIMDVVDEDCRFSATEELVEALKEIVLDNGNTRYSEFRNFETGGRVPLDLMKGDADDKLLLGLYVIQGYLASIAAGQLAIIEALHRIAPPPPNPNLESGPSQSLHPTVTA